MNKQKIFISLLSLGVIGALGHASLRPVYAQEGQPFSPLITRIVEKFNLDKTEVDKLVQEFHTEKRSEMQKLTEDRLNKAVEEGNLTVEQKDKILAKLEEMKDNKEEMANLTQEERMQKMKEHRTEIEQWANDNDIDLKYLMHPHKGFHSHGFWKNYNNTQDQ